MSDKPLYDHAGITLYCADCREILPTLASGSVDVVITDPPYNAGQSYGRHNDSMPAAEYQEWLAGILAECGRIARLGVVYFPGNTNVFTAGPVLASAGLDPRRLLGWHRREFAGALYGTGGPAWSWEPIVWAIRPGVKPWWNRQYGHGGRDFLVVPATSGDPMGRIHPCPKPLRVMRWLVNMFTPENGSVLDPFAGCGTTLRAAKDLGRSAIGIELEERFCAAAVRRLGQECLSFAEATNE